MSHATTLRPAKMRDGSDYIGNQMFRGNGVLKSCCTCGKHKASTEGWQMLTAGMSCPECVAKQEHTKPTERKEKKTGAEPWHKPGHTFQVRDESGAVWPPGFSPRLHFAVGPRAISEAITQQLDDPEVRAERAVNLK